MCELISSVMVGTRTSASFIASTISASLIGASPRFNLASNNSRMRELFDARLNLGDAPMSEAEIVEAMKEADVLVPTITDEINSHMIAQAGDQLKLIANFGNGVDNIDVTSALRRGVT